MARLTKTSRRAKAGRNKQVKAQTSSPTFPYCTTPGSLRRFLGEVPRRPKPEKINNATLKSWDIKDSNANTIIRVLKALDLVDSKNIPTENYTQFMHKETGAAVLGQRVREVYSKLFEHSNEPYKESGESLKNLFNIHSGGSVQTINFQIQTFKALAEYSDFNKSMPINQTGADSKLKGGVSVPEKRIQNTLNEPILHIDLHIHLPENKSRRDYEYIFEDIARYIFRLPGGSNDSKEE